MMILRPTETDFNLQLIAAHFLQTIVKSYSSHRNSDHEGGKEASNLIVFLSELYNFQVVGSTLIYDIIRELVSPGKDRNQSQEGMSEIDVELLLKIVKSKSHHATHSIILRAHERI